jgi:mRNA interferase MazF
MQLDRGTVVLAVLDPTLGHEQRGARPCVLISDSEVIQDQRYPMVCVLPITKTPGAGVLYPALSPSGSGLLTPSYALIDQIRSIDKRRITRVFGRITNEELNMIDEGLHLFLGLS